MAELTANEVLCFIAHQYDNTDRQSLFCSICEFYFLEELVTAKTILVAQCDKIGVAGEIDKLRKKRNNTKSIDDQ